MAQFARPNVDVSESGSWTQTGGTDGQRYTTLDDASPNDSTFIESPGNPSAGDEYTAGLSGIGNPEPGTVTVRYRIAKNASGGRRIDVRVRLRQGGTEVALWTHANITDTLTTHSQALTAPQRDAITDWSALRLQFDPEAVGGGAARTSHVFWGELEAPDPTLFTRTAADDAGGLGEDLDTFVVKPRAASDGISEPGDLAERSQGSFARTADDLPALGEDASRQIVVGRMSSDGVGVGGVAEGEVYTPQLFQREVADAVGEPVAEAGRIGVYLRFNPRKDDL